MNKKSKSAKGEPPIGVLGTPYPKIDGKGKRRAGAKKRKFERIVKFLRKKSKHLVRRNHTGTHGVIIRKRNCHKTSNRRISRRMYRLRIAKAHHRFLKDRGICVTDTALTYTGMATNGGNSTHHKHNVRGPSKPRPKHVHSRKTIRKWRRFLKWKARRQKHEPDDRMLKGKIRIATINFKGRKVDEAIKFMENHKIDILCAQEAMIPYNSVWRYGEFICISSTDIGTNDKKAGRKQKIDHEVLESENLHKLDPSSEIQLMHLNDMDVITSEIKKGKRQKSSKS